ncbi:ABC transporter ATP-binding protein [Sinorhizobium sp. BG8]|uniref:ABC transporter ATP-binding protein n=1 Tax=Sinorhizobium sp. BG8 TaxID=2613773 RepID=UPI00193E566E|nr:ABC transporter ATP-binding protein [Sinorhizobium sp. BG8]QRM54417.1 ABC transporter ATP-binding protein [Sinorhizobium sp. BG8]
MKLSAREVSWSAGGVSILEGVSLDIVPGEFLGIVGPNGSGKTSLMSLLAGIRRPRSGTVLLDGQPMQDLGRREVARCLALVEQQAETGERITARQAVELGRTPHLGALSPWSIKDDGIVDEAIRNVDMAQFAGRMWHTLSGGERQRLHIARALAQQPKILLLDEPTNHLDIGHQIGLLHLVRQQGLTVVAALHDLNHAAMFCDRIAVMNGGRIAALGRPRAVLNAERIHTVFGVDVHVEHEGEHGCHIRYRAPGFSTTEPELARRFS